MNPEPEKQKLNSDDLNPEPENYRTISEKFNLEPEQQKLNSNNSTLNSGISDQIAKAKHSPKNLIPAISGKLNKTFKTLNKIFSFQMSPETKMFANAPNPGPSP